MTSSFAPDYTDPFVGWRAWLIENGYLWSLNFGVRWPGEVQLTATCRLRTTHPSPDAGCKCGIYAVESRRELLTQVAFAPGVRNVAIGEVNLWGVVMKGQIGWRAQFAFPKRVLVPHKGYKSVMALRARYRVPVTLDNIFEVGDDPS